MTNQPDRPETDDPRVLALAKARQQIAYESPLNAVCPPWDGLSEQEQKTSLLEARNWMYAAMLAGLVADRATAWRELADRADPANEASWFGDFGHMVGEWMRDQAEQEASRLINEVPVE
jgi:hypothetical protein